MDPFKPKESVDQSTAGSIAGDLIAGLVSVIRGELRLAKVELGSAASNVQRKATLAMVSALVLGLGAASLTAFAVVGLGEILNHRYWLSALIVGAVLGSAGWIAFFATLRSMKLESFTLPHFRRSLHEEENVVIHKMAEVTRLADRKLRDVSLRPDERNDS